MTTKHLAAFDSRVDFRVQHGWRVPYCSNMLLTDAGTTISALTRWLSSQSGGEPIKLEIYAHGALGSTGSPLVMPPPTVRPGSPLSYAHEYYYQIGIGLSSHNVSSWGRHLQALGRLQKITFYGCGTYSRYFGAHRHSHEAQRDLLRQLAQLCRCPVRYTEDTQQLQIDCATRQVGGNPLARPAYEIAPNGTVQTLR